MVPGWLASEKKSVRTRVGCHRVGMAQYHWLAFERHRYNTVYTNSMIELSFAHELE
jgi:hypothetical protein